jgi:hypothetical protein
VLQQARLAPAIVDTVRCCKFRFCVFLCCFILNSFFFFFFPNLGVPQLFFFEPGFSCFWLVPVMCRVKHITASELLSTTYEVHEVPLHDGHYISSKYCVFVAAGR